MSDPPIVLIRGDDPGLIARALQRVTGDLLGDAEQSLVVEELLEADYQDSQGSFSLGPVVAAAEAPPLLADFRIVIARELSRFSKVDDISPLLRYIENPMSTTRLVLVWEKGPETSRLSPIPKVLHELVLDVSGRVVDARLPRGKSSRRWVQDQVALSELNLSGEAISLLSEHLGDEQSRLPGLLETFESIFGQATSIDSRDIMPYLGEAGGVPPWELTDSIATGDVAQSIATLHRMQRNGARHPLQILSWLHSHYGRILRLEGSGLRNEKDAAEALAIKGSTFPAKKALYQARKLGRERAGRAINLLAVADLDLRGATAVPQTTIMEVLVARLAALHR